MKTHAQHLAAGVAMLIAMVGTAADAHTEDTASSGDGRRVRSSNPTLTTAIHQAGERSTTFRNLVQGIEATDGVVHVEHGTCASHARGCLLKTMALSGPHRILHILVDTNVPEDSLMGTIGHELQHAIEVLTNGALRTEAAMHLFYRRTGTSWGRAYETDAAVAAGRAVRAEAQISRSR